MAEFSPSLGRQKPNEGRQRLTTSPGASRLIVIWTPTLLVAVGTGMVLIDFLFGSHTSRIIDGTSYRTISYDEIYNLTLHLAMLAVALAAALVIASLARRVVLPSSAANGMTISAPDRSGG